MRARSYGQTQEFGEASNRFLHCTNGHKLLVTAETTMLNTTIQKARYRQSQPAFLVNAEFYNVTIHGNPIRNTKSGPIAGSTIILIRCYLETKRINFI